MNLLGKIRRWLWPSYYSNDHPEKYSNYDVFDNQVLYTEADLDDVRERTTLEVMEEILNDPEFSTKPLGDGVTFRIHDGQLDIEPIGDPKTAATCCYLILSGQANIILVSKLAEQKESGDENYNKCMKYLQDLVKVNGAVVNSMEVLGGVAADEG